MFDLIQPIYSFGPSLTNFDHRPVEKPIGCILVFGKIIVMLVYIFQSQYICYLGTFLFLYQFSAKVTPTKAYIVLLIFHLPILWTMTMTAKHITIDHIRLKLYEP